MISLHDRAYLVLEEAWMLLPPLKEEALILEICLEPLGAVHGRYHPDSGILGLNPSLFAGSFQMLPLIDINGDSPPKAYPLVSRAIHTAIHECFHAIGYATGLHTHHDWLKLSGWWESWGNPIGTARHHELRPGWKHEISPWHHATTAFFPRYYSGKNPFEDYADCCTAIALGWTEPFGLSGAKKLAWLRKSTFGETGSRALQAATARWRVSLDAHIDAALSPAQREARMVRTATRTLTANVSTTLAQWRGQWLATLPALDPAHGVGWLPVAPLAEDLAVTLRPPLTRLWGQLTESTERVPADLLVRPIVTFARTTMRHLAATLAPVLPLGPQAIAEALDTAYAEALSTRMPLLVESLTRHATQAAARVSAVLDGATHATWHTTSGTPCAWCADLEGQTFALTSAPLWAAGETLTTSEGKEMALDYEDIFHPPLHPSCRCELSYS